MMEKKLVLFSSVILFLVFARPAFAQDSSAIVQSWLKQHCVPIRTVEPGNDLSDLQFLKSVFKDVQGIGLGEATHGTSEFVKVRHRLVQFLVTEMGFTAFALESSYSDCEPINDYILNGKGNLAEALTMQGYSPWDTEEFKSMLEWMRQYNEHVSEKKKVHFYGIDIPLTFQRVGRGKVRSYLQKNAPEKLGRADSIFHALGDEDHGWPTRLDQSALEPVFMPLHELIRYFTANKELLVARSSTEEWEHTLKYLQVMEQGLFDRVKNIPASLLMDSLSRDEYMGQNLIYLMKVQKPNSKFIFWAHNFHVCNNPQENTVGYFMKQWLGSKYYALGLECHDGTFNARVLMPDSTWGEIKADTISGIQKPFTACLHQVGVGNLFVDWRPAISNTVIDKWLDTPCNFGGGGWKSNKTEEHFEFKKEKGFYDGLLYIEHSTPTHPTQNAQARSTARIGF